MPSTAARGGSYAALLLAAVGDSSAAASASAPAAPPFPLSVPIPPSRPPPLQTVSATAAAPAAAAAAAVAAAPVVAPGEDVVDLTLEYGDDFGGPVGGPAPAVVGAPVSASAGADVAPRVPRWARGKAAATVSGAAAAAAADTAVPPTTIAARRRTGVYGSPAPTWSTTAASAGYGYGVASGCGGNAAAPAGAPAGKASKVTKAARAAARDADVAAAAAGGKGAKVAAAAPPAAKRSRKGGKEDASGGGGGVVEKRATRYRPIPSQAMQERLSRAFAHRLFLVGVDTPAVAVGDDDDEARTYSVLGSTANVYTVIIRQRPSCTCPDHIKRGDPCKHILFVMHRVLKVDRLDPCLWQTSLLPSELARIFGAAPPSGEGRGLLASPAVRASYAAATGRQPAAGGDPDAARPTADIAVADGRRPLSDGDDCPICCEEIGAGDLAATDWCRSCKNNVHTQCIGKWLGVKAAAGEPATCPMCRAGWHTGGGPRGTGRRAAAAAAAAARPEGGYVNLASVSEAHAQPLSMAERYPRTSRFMTDRWRSRRRLNLVRDDDDC
ncbi:hypothetical protein MMPV_007135 [Pyropia vietnamensis]